MTGINAGIPLLAPKIPEIGKKKNTFFTHSDYAHRKSIRLHGQQ